jgi:hypothetical protein
MATTTAATFETGTSAAALTRALLAAGAAAGPVYVGVGLVHALNRPGFDLSRHSLSLLSNGSLGWIHILTLVVSGVLTVAGAAGMRRALRGSRGGRWAPLLVGVYGLGLIAAGLFTADPAMGFPPGTPATGNAISSHGLLHFVSGALGFLALIAASFVLARRFAGLGQRGWAVYSVATGIIFFAAFFGIASGSGTPAINLGFGAAVVLAWLWLSLVALRLRSAIHD